MQPTRPRHPDFAPPRRPDRPRFCPHCGIPAVDADTCPNCGQDYLDRRIETVVGGKYKIESLIGKGGFGRVYRGLHLALGSPVAVKFLLAEWAARPDLRVRFKREVVALTKLGHPNSVVVHDFGEDAGELYMVMEYVRGRPLSHVLATGEPLPMARIGAILDQVLQVIETAHAHGIVHRDLKPDNVMLVDTVDGADHVKVLDFGLALMVEQQEQRLTATQAVAGTPLYMSPEQCRGRDVGPPTDVYAIGTMLYEMLAGVTPFGADNQADIIVQHLYTAPPPIASRGYRRPAPAALDALVMRALAKRPEDRPAAAAFRAALGEAVRGTDALSRAAVSVDQRIAAEGLPRELRGLPPAKAADVATTPMVAPVVGEGQEPYVLVWGMSDLRSGPLRTAMAVNGVAAGLWRDDGPPPATQDEQAVKAVVIQAGPGAVDKVQAVRAQAATARLPVLIVDVGADDTAGYIRAGASDVLLPGAGDEAVCKKLWRLIRRGR